MHNFLDCENWPITPSVEDLASPVTLHLIFGIDRNVEELTITITFSLECSGPAISILKAVSFIERRP